jgi:hypothetical protein
MPRFRRSVRLLFSIAIVLTFPGVTACVNDKRVEYDHTGYCADYAEFNVGELIVQNNVWGKQGITTYEQCVFGTGSPAGFPVGWTWTWPEPPGGVMAYPEIIYGRKPWSSSSTTTYLPRRLSDINTLTVSYDITQTAAGSHNLSFDIWLNDADPPTPDNITREIMIWLDHAVMGPAGTYQGPVTIDGEAYVFYMGSVGTGTWTYIAFVKQTPELSGDTNVKLFFDYLVSIDAVEDTEYCSAVEIGNEVVSGSGRTEFSSYTVTAN